MLGKVTLEMQAIFHFGRTDDGGKRFRVRPPGRPGVPGMSVLPAFARAPLSRPPPRYLFRFSAEGHQAARRRWVCSQVPAIQPIDTESCGSSPHPDTDETRGRRPRGVRSSRPPILRSWTDHHQFDDSPCRGLRQLASVLSRRPCSVFSRVAVLQGR